ncbi:waprin-Thr1-like [Anticarsia gemmatalis]|uniref:waprin-Thr1-like n=1 Tax=Anticarsia gemmatalis TaxID=129554 RepID=UPI003F776071
MGVLKVLVFAITMLFISEYVTASSLRYFPGMCPPKNEVDFTFGVCESDDGCRANGMICCPNAFNSKSCTPIIIWSNESDADGDSSEDIDSDSLVRQGVYCAGAKCMPWEVCKLDKNTNKKKCMRP